MGEAERIAGAQHVRVRELVRGGQRRRRGRPASAAARCSGASSSNTATARASACARGDSAPSRRSTERPASAPPARPRPPAPRAGRRGLTLDRREQLAHLQRVAGGQLEAALAEPSSASGRRSRTSAATAAAPSDASTRTCAAGSAAELLEQPPSPGSPARRRPATAIGWSAQAAGEIDQEAQRRLVGPLRVVDREQQRPALGQPRDEPVQRVQDREARLGRGRLGAGVEDRARRRGRPGQQLVASRRGARAAARAATARRPSRTRARARARAPAAPRALARARSPSRGRSAPTCRPPAALRAATARRARGRPLRTARRPARARARAPAARGRRARSPRAQHPTPGERRSVMSAPSTDRGARAGPTTQGSIDMRTKSALFALSSALLCSAVLAVPSAHAAARDGRCESGEFCLYFNSGQAGPWWT